MERRLTVTFTVCISGASGSPGLGDAMQRRLTEATGFRYSSEAETIFYMLERLAEDFGGAPGHCIARVAASETVVAEAEQEFRVGEIVEYSFPENYRLGGPWYECEVLAADARGPTRIKAAYGKGELPVSLFQGAMFRHKPADPWVVCSALSKHRKHHMYFVAIERGTYRMQMTDDVHLAYRFATRDEADRACRALTFGFEALRFVDATRHEVLQSSPLCVTCDGTGWVTEPGESRQANERLHCSACLGTGTKP